MRSIVSFVHLLAVSRIRQSSHHPELSSSKCRLGDYQGFQPQTMATVFWALPGNLMTASHLRHRQGQVAKSAPYCSCCYFEWSLSRVRSTFYLIF